ncbi:U-box domain-containing protein [Legionella pneumophila]|uniref:U-box domain-containing protein n=1 Tax=Legionella pneumophila TaxID=446 RepID=UPI00399C5737
MNGKNDALIIKDDFDTPELLTCPLTCEIYLEPIMVFPSCHIYEMEYIQMHVEKNPHAPLCPLTNIPIGGILRFVLPAATLPKRTKLTTLTITNNEH